MRFGTKPKPKVCRLLDQVPQDAPVELLGNGVGSALGGLVHGLGGRGSLAGLLVSRHGAGHIPKYINIF